MKWESIRHRLSNFINELTSVFRSFNAADLRWSYLITLALVGAGIVVNVFFVNGWSVWPFVAVIALLVFINEQVDRSGQGFPPLQVYAFFIGSLLLYALVLSVVSALNLFILLAAMSVVGYFSVKAHLKRLERERLIAQRERDGQCIFCGEPIDPESAYCLECGNEPPAVALKRISEVLKNASKGTRMRAILSQKTPASDARAKESALLARSYNRQRSARRKP